MPPRTHRRTRALAFAAEDFAAFAALCGGYRSNVGTEAVARSLDAVQSRHQKEAFRRWFRGPKKERRVVFGVQEERPYTPEVWPSLLGILLCGGSYDTHSPIDIDAAVVTALGKRAAVPLSRVSSRQWALVVGYLEPLDTALLERKRVRRAFGLPAESIVDVNYIPKMQLVQGKVELSVEDADDASDPIQSWFGKEDATNAAFLAMARPSSSRLMSRSWEVFAPVDLHP